MVGQNIASRTSARTSGWKARYTVLSLLWLGWMFSFLDRMVMSISLPFIGAEFHLDKTTQGWIISAFFIGYAAFQIPGGFLSDKFGPRRVMVISIILWSIFTSLTGFATSLITLLTIRLLFGIGEGCYPASTWKTISTYFPSTERGRATAIQSSVNTLGPALAAIVAATIIGWFGWRMVFIVLGVPGLLIALGMFIFCRDNPKDNPQMTEAELRELDEDNTLETSGLTLKKVPFINILKMPILWQMGAIWFLFDITFWGFNAWLPSYLMEARGLSLAKTGFIAAIPFLFGAAGTLAGGYVSDKFKKDRKLIYFGVSLVAALFLYLTYSVENLNQAIIYQCLSALFMFFGMAIFWGFFMDSVKKEIMGSASGIVNFGGQMAGVFSPPIMGFLIQQSNGNYNSAFIFMIIALIASACVMLMIKNTELAASPYLLQDKNK